MAKLLGHEITTTAELEAHAAEVAKKFIDAEDFALLQLNSAEDRLRAELKVHRLLTLIVGIVAVAALALHLFH